MRRVGTTGAVAARHAPPRVPSLSRSSWLRRQHARPGRGSALVIAGADETRRREISLRAPSPCPDRRRCTSPPTSSAALAVTTQPGTDATWHVGRLVSFPSLAQTPLVIGLACAGAHLCVGIDSGGDTYSSSDPAGGPGAWHATALPGGDSAAAIACPAAQLCVAPSSDSAGRGHVDHSVSRGAAGSTRPSPKAPPLPTPCSCPSATEYVIGTDGGHVLTSTDPAAGGATYVAHRVTAHGHSTVPAIISAATGGGRCPARRPRRGSDHAGPSRPEPRAQPPSAPRAARSGRSATLPVRRVWRGGQAGAGSTRALPSPRPGCTWPPILPAPGPARPSPRTRWPARLTASA